MYLFSLFSATTTNPHGACGAKTTLLDTSCLPTAQANDTTVATIMNIVLATVASIAVLIIVIAGFRYIVAHGEPSAVAQARMAILYALVGLIITMVAFAIVTFVVKGLL
jgi:hypothetical protein